MSKTILDTIMVTLGSSIAQDGKMARQFAIRILEAESGCERVYVGTGFENPQRLLFFCEYNPAAPEVDHRSSRRLCYERLCTGQPFSDIMQDVDFNLCHIPMGPRKPEAVLSSSAPQVIEVGIGYFMPMLSSSEQQRWLDLQEKHERDNMVPWDGYLAYTGGWAPDERASNGLTKAYVGLWSWTSKESHDQCAARPVWAEVTKPIADFGGFVDVDMFHVTTVVVERSLGS